MSSRRRLVLTEMGRTVHSYADESFNLGRELPGDRRESEDDAMIRAFGQEGGGLFPAASVFERQLRKQDTVGVVGRTDRSHLFASSAERKLHHPAFYRHLRIGSQGSLHQVI